MNEATKKVVPALVIALGLSIGGIAGAVYATSVSKFSDKSAITFVGGGKDIAIKPEYSINANGRTYGNLKTETNEYIPFENEPDLILCEGDNGIVGYAYKTDLMGTPPASPEEAIRIQEEDIREGNITRKINLYKEDGTTVVDTFTIGETRNSND